MERSEATNIASTIFAKDGKTIAEGSEHNGVFLFFSRGEDGIDPTQPALVVSENGERFEACSPGTETFNILMKSKRFM